jgi:hypothetical protein
VATAPPTPGSGPLRPSAGLVLAALAACSPGDLARAPAGPTALSGSGWRGGSPLAFGDTPPRLRLTAAAPPRREAASAGFLDPEFPTEKEALTRMPSPRPVTYGNRFLSKVPVRVVGVRFYAEPPMSGGRTGALYLGWTPPGRLVKQTARVQVKPGTGWQVIPFDEPVTLDADEQYTVALWIEPSERLTMVGIRSYFDAPVSRGAWRLPLQAGAYTYQGEKAPALPDQTMLDTLYLVDVAAVEGSRD